MNRNELILDGLERTSARIIELGASFAPVAPKHAGWRTTVIDHTDRSGLVAKYKVFPQIDVSAIEEVDYVWTGGPLAAVIPEADHGSFDAIVASHVIEHIVDPIAFLADAARLLNPRGRVLLAVPDLRLCFDCMRPTSTTGQVIAAMRERRTRHTWAAMFDAHAYDMRTAEGGPSWARGAAPTLRLTDDVRSVGQRFLSLAEPYQGEYLDVHGWTFTPASFALIMLELHALKLSEWRVARLIEREAVEFLAFLEREPRRLGTADLAAERARLMTQRLAELGAQAAWMKRPDHDTHAQQSTDPPGSLQDEIALLRAATDALVRLGQGGG